MILAVMTLSNRRCLLTKTYYPQQKSQASLYLIHDHLQNFHSVHASLLRFRTQILGADAIFKPWIIAESPRTLISRQLTSQSTIINQTGCRAENRGESRQAERPIIPRLGSEQRRPWTGQVCIETLASAWSGITDTLEKREWGDPRVS